MKKRTTEQVIETLKEIFVDENYDYSQLVFENNKKPVRVFCPKENHGWFEATPRNMIERKKGCPLCGGYTMNSNTFIAKAKEIHGDRYDYSKVIYINGKTKVIIGCKTHGDFLMEPNNHTNGRQGCKLCAHEKFRTDYRNDLETFLRKSIEKHGYFYDYSLVNYINNRTNVEIICPIHGSFFQTPGNHYNHGMGCIKCGYDRVSDFRKDTKESFISKAKVKHGDRYNYDQVNYIDCSTEVKIVCSIHGEFYQKPMFHVRGCGCQSCAKTESKWEGEMKDYIRSLGFSADKNKTLINPWELDVYIPEKNLAVEANGLWWHSEYNDTINEKYHINKTNMCNKLGIQLLHIFEDEWHNKKDIVKSMLQHKLGKTTNKVYARECIIRFVSNEESKKFLSVNHIQGALTSLDINIGLYHNDELVSLMCFGPSRYDKNYQYELYRFCSKVYTHIVGGASRLFKHFIREHDVVTILSYANRRFSCGEIYESLGLQYEGNTESPNYWYIHKDHMTRFGRQNFQKHLLKDKLKVYDESLTESENMKLNNYYKIWDCGNMIYSWNR